MSWRIFQQLFNAPPRKHAKSVTDPSGRKFWMDWDVERYDYIGELHVIHRGRWVGLLGVLREHDRSITLVDLILDQKYRTKDRSLEKVMIEELIRWAEANNFKRIVGLVAPRDGSTVTSLADWYRGQGFNVQDGQVSLELQGGTA